LLMLSIDFIETRVIRIQEMRVISTQGIRVIE
jgi:hypothetical protein